MQSARLEAAARQSTAGAGAGEPAPAAEAASARRRHATAAAEVAARVVRAMAAVRRSSGRRGVVVGSWEAGETPDVEGQRRVSCGAAKGDVGWTPLLWRGETCDL
uniref:Uncharacterized protein n=1 Tax=Arundo donax TaxID=35708 RepID=A0A0A8Z2M9_ARUDO